MQKRRSEQEQRRYILNERIEARELRVLNDRGEHVGVLAKEAAINKAYEEGIDLVLISPHATPPVAKLIDFKKFLYQENKKNRDAKKGTRKGNTKDIQLSLFIGPNDFDRMVQKAQEFLRDGFQVRIKLVLKGREVIKRDMAFELIKRFIENCGECTVALPPKLQGRTILAVIVHKR